MHIGIKNKQGKVVLTVNVDGSEDQEISCFKPDKPCANGRKILEEQMLLINEKSLFIDPFAATDSDIKDTNNEMFIIEDDDDIEIYRYDK